MLAPRSMLDIGILYSDACLMRGRWELGRATGQLIAAAPALSSIAGSGKACGCIRVLPCSWHMQWPPR